MAIVTITGSDVSGGSPSGGGVGGASNLTTAGAVPYVASAGVLTQAPTGLFYDSAVQSLKVGVTKIGTGSASRAEFSYTTSFAGSNFALIQDSSAKTFLNSSVSQGLVFSLSNAEVARFAATTGNLLIGTTTDDGSAKLQVAGSAIINAGNSLRLQNAAANQFASMYLNASAVVEMNYPFTVGPSSSLTSGVTLGVMNGTPTTGSTLLAVQAGAGQSGNLLSIRNNAGTEISSIDSNGFINAYASGTITARLLGASGYGVELASNRLLLWDAVASITGAPDTGVARNAAGVLEINNGTAGTLRDLTLRNLTGSGNATLNQSQYFQWASASRITSPSDGVVTLYNDAVSSFNRLQFGGTTSSFPALKRSTTIVQVRLADDSANTQIQASRFISDQTTPSASTDAGTAGAIWADTNYVYVQTAAGTVKRIALTTF